MVNDPDILESKKEYNSAEENLTQKTKSENENGRFFYSVIMQNDQAETTIQDQLYSR